MLFRSDFIAEDDEIEKLDEIEELNETEEFSEEPKGQEDEDLELVTEDEEITEDDNPKEEEVENTFVKEEMKLPVEGKLGTPFTTDSLVYSETLEAWSGHKGIDIFAKEGSSVVATLAGKVTEVYKDDLWGIVILVDHGNGLMTKYANLSTDEMVKEGQEVKKGDVISAVGKSAPIEMMMEPHLHFEVINDGICTDPKDYLPNLNYSK